MHIQVYLPTDTFRQLHRLKKGYLIGKTVENAVVVVQIVEEVGTLPDGFSVVATLNLDSGLRILNTPALSIEGPHTYTIVTFRPPNLANLEYFSVDPILLQSTGQTTQTALLDHMIACHADPQFEHVLEELNLCRKNRMLVAGKTQPAVAALKRNSIIQYVVAAAMRLCTAAILLLNKQFYSYSAVTVSALCLQLDLRLRQLSFFPIQFRCFHDASTLQKNHAKLSLPAFNEKYNVNNSNYINLFNSIWLIVNDVLLGITAHRLFVRHQQHLVGAFNNFLENVLFSKLDVLVQWVSAEHPLGFKLNDELGEFLGQMFFWTLSVWGGVFGEMRAIFSSEPCVGVCAAAFKAVCYCGFTFLVAFLCDYVKLVALHVHFFNLVTTKVYNRQVETLKLLLQLFRGKKYNVLRQRLDNLDPDESHTDQLLLGTLMFTLLVYLLPTTFAFYLLFFATKVLVLVAVKLGDKLLIVLNFYPIFVVLLKLKNSNRLQGGVSFSRPQRRGNCSWLHMQNKALLYGDIFASFVRLFRREGRFERFAGNFAEGRRLEVSNTKSMKFHYLMLPARVSGLVEAWEAS